MKFLKEHSYDAIRLFIMQIGITIFSFFIYTAAGVIFDEEGHIATTALLIISLFAIGFYFALLYVTAWEWGAKDKIRIDGGRMEPHSTKAIKISLLANSLNLFLSFVAAISFLFCMGGITAGFAEIGSVFLIIIRFIAMMFQGLIKTVFLSVEGTLIGFFATALSYFVMSVITVFVTHLGYFAGTKDFKIIRTSKKKNYE